MPADSLAHPGSSRRRRDAAPVFVQSVALTELGRHDARERDGAGVARAATPPARVMPMTTTPCCRRCRRRRCVTMRSTSSRAPTRARVDARAFQQRVQLRRHGFVGGALAAARDGGGGADDARADDANAGDAEAADVAQALLARG